MQFIFTLGQVLFGGYFLLSGFSHFKNLTGMASYAATRKIPAAKFAVALTGAMLMLGGLGIILSFMTPWALLLIILFLLGVTFVMHDFWHVTDPGQKMIQQLFFMRNIALLGASLMFFSLFWF